MKSRDLNKLGIPMGESMSIAIEAIAAAAQAGVIKEELHSKIKTVAADPKEHTDDGIFGKLASKLESLEGLYTPREEPAPFRQWGEDLEEGALRQMRQACSLPVSVRGALMPDAHQGYGLPIGGVLATRNAVIPYAVGMDIACRMKLSILDLPVQALNDREDPLRKAIEEETRFGIGAAFKTPRQHPVMEEDWNFSQVTARVQKKALHQLGTSGSGNHFVEFGELTLPKPAFGLEAGTYLALLSHGGSRWSGGQVAKHYSSVASQLHPELPRELQRLAWLDLDSADGQEYWAAMELMGRYAAANHACIHEHVSKNMGAQILADVENHHNFAWIEEVDGQKAVVHRKGATPAGTDALGIIPGSMATPAYVVQGKGSQPSINSASHGAGRKLSRTAAKKAFTWAEGKKFLAERGVTLISGDLDEVPMAYKDIEEVMAAQADLVEILAKFQPKLVKMAPEG